MKLEELLDLLKTTFSCAKESGRTVAGVDICGESESGEGRNRAENIEANRRILDCLRNMDNRN